MSKDKLSSTLSNISQLENFFFALANELPKQKKNFKKGQDITTHLKNNDIQIPEVLQDDSIEWLGVDTDYVDDENHGISIVRPGNPTALGLTIGCVKIRRWRVCLECGWLYCRVVIKGSF